MTERFDIRRTIGSDVLPTGSLGGETIPIGDSAGYPERLTRWRRARTMMRHASLSVCGLLAVHFLACYLTMLLWIIGPQLATGIGSIRLSFALVLMMTIYGYVYSLPYVLPLAILSLVILRPFAQRSAPTVLVTGGLCGALTVSLVGYQLSLTASQEFRFRTLLVSAVVAGSIGAWIVKALLARLAPSPAPRQSVSRDAED
ncbi:hypothetical protein [Rhizobium phaseoli]|uniref:Uncharacterized protein n=2 Tax=Rhizobium phaseoli TaxID=396 RepID=A0ABN4QHL5_9HYPH|nr:hypothetical protein [Rhizobium phaseoli]ANL83908.1 hypothetical protein AMC81_CH01097 [Rhizobium phaseoli]ANL90416.1 hypothetical protein AMC80_CH01097 [Rhizobium phaseoli]MDH6649035.1 hypothetical protein [Rhizobium esperanzae]PCD65291.1 hypothetical protein CO648_25280 [Rhizobium phaseoli]